MNLTNEDALDVMVAIGRQALERGKVEQALTILGGVLTKAPNHTLAWFSLGRAHLLKGAHDHAALSYHRAATLASTQRGLPANLQRMARDNSVLCGEKVLPRDWLPAMQDPTLADCWGAALTRLATSAAGVAASETDTPLAAASTLSENVASRAATLAATPPRSAKALVVGGLGLQALQLHALLKAAAAPAARATLESLGASGGKSSSGPTDSAPAVRAVEVTWVLPDELSRTLAAQMAAAAGLPRTEVRVVTGWAAVAAQVAASSTAEAATAEAEAKAKVAWAVGLLVAVGACTARWAPSAWASLLAQARPLLAPEAVLCPRVGRLKGVLASSEDLVAMNEVDLDWIREDTDGLEYGPANELLWRPARSMQVSGFRYSLLSEPFLLVPEVSAQQLMQQPAAALAGAPAPAEPEALTAPNGAGAGANAAGDGGVSGRASAAMGRKTHELVVTCSASGRVDCLVCWAEYELAPGVWVSYAPHEIQGRTDPPDLCPHVWQRVQYLSARPTAVSGQRLGFQVTVSAGGDDVRVEYDEDVITALPPAVAGAAPGERASGPDHGDDGGDLPAWEPLLPAGEPLLPPGEGVESASGSDEEDPRVTANQDQQGPEAAAGKQGLPAVASKPEATAAGAAAAATQSGLILPYHMSMLNDRVRTRCFAAGIRGAVSEAKAGSGSQPLVVLDVGAGTGLLSMLAARAGAECVVGCERELALAVAAGALVSANGCQDAVRIVQAHSKALKVATEDPDADVSAAAAPSATAQPPAGGEAPRVRREEAASGQQQERQGPDAAATSGPERQQGQQEGKSEAQAGPAATEGAESTRDGEKLGQGQEQGRKQGQQLSGAHLPRPAGLVVHEIFGTDPLSEHILPSMSQVQESLTAPDALYMPSAFRLVAAAARSDLLEARLRRVQPPVAWGSECVPGQGERLADLDAKRLERVLPAAAAATLQAWAPWKAELDLLRVPDLVLTTEPVIVSTLRLDQRPLPRSYRASADTAQCPPTPVGLRFKRLGPDGQERPLPQEATAEATAAQPLPSPEAAPEAPKAAQPPPVEPTATAGVAANCIVYWFEADCGSGGWLSTCPGSGSTYYGHWVQNVQFLDSPLPALDPGLVEAARLRVRLAAECVVDRVRFTAEWAQEGDEDSSSSDSEP